MHVVSPIKTKPLTSLNIYGQSISQAHIFQKFSELRDLMLIRLKFRNQGF